MRDDQISGPSWLDSESYDIVAKVPTGTTKEQVNAMLRNLLVERFNLTFHHETKDLSVYELIAGKNGSKLKEADLNVPPPAVALTAKIGRQGRFSQPPPSGRFMFAG